MLSLIILNAGKYVGLCRQNVCTIFLIYLKINWLSEKCRHVGKKHKNFYFKNYMCVPC